MTPAVGGRIDTHQHFVPELYRKTLSDRNFSYGRGSSIPQWSPESALDFMDESGIATGMLSISTPGVHFGDDAAARKLARALNEYGAGIVRERPERFGLFAVLTLPDVEGAIAEARYALDDLKADGVVLLANVNGTYLGDAAFEPLFAMLDERAAVVFVHPCELPGTPIDGVAPFAADFLLDTTRAAIKLVTSGTLDRYPRLKIVLSHAGGFLPYASYRIASMFMASHDIDYGLALFRRFYFDLALSSTPAALPSVFAFADSARITYGSDFPYAPVPVCAVMRGFEDEFALADDVRHAIDRRNAETLFTRLKIT